MIARADKYDRPATEMIKSFLNGNCINCHVFCLAFLACYDTFMCTLFTINYLAFYTEKISFMLDCVPIGVIEVGLHHTDVVKGIKDISLADAIGTSDAYILRVKLECLFRVVLEMIK